ncbi:N,N-dimethylformamidase beta subunit family domain-containing protein [Streptomyces sp. MS1.HAVA.3]|uniref:N,N-dimethylformamidase beta subunit family domain-containing protein n=1 Tax=Streptomyces caledonius TaxID=3134107 RepID=A0ABU8TY89_9ACTN
MRTLTSGSPPWRGVSNSYLISGPPRSTCTRSRCRPCQQREGQKTPQASRTRYAKDPGFRQGSAPTNDFRRPPAPDPESSLLGVIYAGYPVDATYVVSHPDHWILAGTGARACDSFPHLVGIEFDRVNLSFPTPRPIEVLAHSPVVCKGRPSLPGGAAVFATGTVRWVEALDASGPGGRKANHGLDTRRTLHAHRHRQRPPSVRAEVRRPGQARPGQSTEVFRVGSVG